MPPTCAYDAGKLSTGCAIMDNPLDAVSDEILYEQYADPRNGSVSTLAKWYGVSFRRMYSRLSRNNDAWCRAQRVRAAALHEYSVSVLFDEPERIIDTAGNSRLDPAHVTLMKLRADHASRLAGILDSRYSERQLVEMTAAGPLAEYIGRITAAGSSIPIAPPTPRVIDGSHEVVGTDGMGDSLEDDLPGLLGDR
jgi:hypothetical protein